MSQPHNYAEAGVDVEAGNRAVDLIRQHVRSTVRPGVVSEAGFFGGMFALAPHRQPVLVASADSVGTKVKLASLLGRYDTVGVDIVNHCVNDILTCGAEPLFFLDYVAAGKLVPERIERVVAGVAEACRAAGCALLGGETAEMPDVYAGDDFDLAGFIVGVVEQDAVLDGRGITAGDVLLALPSSGLHTNGYSLVRKMFRVGVPDVPVERQHAAMQQYWPELGRSLMLELLEPHRCYWPLLKPALPRLKGMAHITGGGITGNVPRVLPAGLAARFETRAWAVPPIFRLIQQQGKVTDEEMRRTFNMGLGMVLICGSGEVERVRTVVPEAFVVGDVVEQAGIERVAYE